MTKYELILRVEHNCPYTTFSQSMPGAVTMHWCSTDRDVLEISTPVETAKEKLDSEIGHLIDELHAKLVRAIDISPNLRIIVYRHRFSSMKQNINKIIESSNAIEIQPTTYRDGGEWYRIVCFNNDDVHSLYVALSKVAKVETVSQDVLPDASIKGSVLISRMSILGKLTRKQQDAVRSAIALGYFDIPSRTSTQTMAEKYGVARTTFEEHLRKAEEKILKSLLPYLEMH